MCPLTGSCQSNMVGLGDLQERSLTPEGSRTKAKKEQKQRACNARAQGHQQAPRACCWVSTQGSCAL